jgi:two-component system OmpR family response regulator
MQTIPDNAGKSPLERAPVTESTPGANSDTLLRKLLLVDDEADGAEFAAILLRSHGLTVIVVHSATDALQTLQRETDIDVVLSDVMMPRMTGLQLAEAVRAMYPAIKVVLMSGYVLPELLRNRERDYLFVEKPYKMDNLLAVLRR